MQRALAAPHDAAGQSVANTTPPSAPAIGRYGSAGALMTTASDYARFLIEVMQPKPVDDYRLNEASRTEMLTPHIEVEGFPIKASWALGWQIWHQEQGTVVAHGGDSDGWHSQSALDFAEDYQGAVMTRIAERKGELISMMPDGRGRVRLEYRIPARGLIGFRTEYLTVTAGTGLLYHIFDGYAPRASGIIGQRTNGAMVSMVQGKALAYALFNLQERGSLFIGHGVEVYEGMVIGINSRDNDLMVNPTKGKQLTNVRAAGSDENIILVPPIRFSLEQALEFIDDDELVEVTPVSIRLRKKFLTENERKRESRKVADAS
jgi:hypothetical protein